MITGLRPVCLSPPPPPSAPPTVTLNSQNGVTSAGVNDDNKGKASAVVETKIPEGDLLLQVSFRAAFVVYFRSV